MHSRAFILRTAAAALMTLAAFAIPMQRCDAADPPSIRSLSTKTSLSNDERSTIRNYAEAYTARLLAAEDPTDLRRVRAKLVDMVRGGASDVFRDTYSRYSLPGLEKAIDDGDPHESVTALIVLSQIGTEQALNTLLSHIDVDRESRRHVRLAAARSIAHLIARNLEADVVPPRKIAATVRTLADDAESEPDPYTLRYMAEAILIATQRPEDDDLPLDELHSYLIRVIEKTAERAASAPDETAAQLLSAIYPTLHRFRIDFIEMEPSTQKTLGRELGPCVRKVLDVATTHWDDFQKTTSSSGSELPEQFITVCERFLATIDSVVRGQDRLSPATRLGEAWQDGDLQRFKTDLGRWRAVLSKPPY